MDQEQADRLLGGGSEISMSVRRDETGIEIEELTLNAARLTAAAQGTLSSLSSDIVAQVSMPSLADADPDFGGRFEAEARLTGPSGLRRLTLSGEAEDLRVGIEQLDRALTGMTTLAAILEEGPGGYELETFRLSNPQLTAQGEGSFVEGALDAMAQIAVPDLAVLRPEWSGSIEAEASLSEEDGRRIIDLTGAGQDLNFGQAGVGEALTGRTDLRVLAEEQDGTVTLRDVRVTGERVQAVAEGTFGEGVTDLRADLSLASLAPFGPGWRGMLDAQATFREDGDGQRRLELSGTGRDLAFGQAQVDGALAGDTQIQVSGTEANGVFTIETAQIQNPRLNATAVGQVGAGATDVQAQLAAVGPALSRRRHPRRRHCRGPPGR